MMTGCFLTTVLCCTALWGDSGQDTALMLAGQDLYLAAPQVSVCRKTEVDNQHVMVFENGFSMTIGDNRLSSRSAVVWLESQGFAEPGFASQAYYQARVYLEEQVSVSRGNRSKTTPISQVVMEGGQSLAVRFLVTGQVFTTADAQAVLDCDRLYATPLYVRGVDASAGMSDGPAVPDSALVPTIAPWDWTGKQPETPRQPAASGQLAIPGEPNTPSRPAAEPKMLYPVHISAVWDPIPTMEKMTLAGGQEVITISGRFYLWQRQSEDSLIEFQADSAVVFYQMGQFEVSSPQDGRDIAQGRIESVYLRGNIVMNDAARTVRADEIFYDFANRQAVIVNASMRAFDEKRGLPIYLSAERLRQAGASMFQAEKVTLTSSEFYFPQISANAARMVLTTDEAVEQRQTPSAGQTDTAARSYDGILYDVDVKYHDFAIFKWPKLRTNFVRPELPISKVRIGNDSDFGTTLETEWYLFRLLGLKEPAGMDTRLAADYYSERGPGGGVRSEYDFGSSYGDFVGYVMNDRGEDDLGRINSRENLKPDTETRGRLSWRNRQFLPDDWQLTTEIGYLSDRNFMESMYRNEFNTDKAQETLVHLKQQRDNWALSLLGKTRINDFENTTEELPTVEYHRKGESLWNHQLTWYSDNRISRLRDRYDEDYAEYNNGASPPGNEDFYTFGSTRQEVDFPLLFGTLRVTPYVAGTYAYEDQDGYDLSLSGRDTGYNANAMLGESGVRTSTMFWKENSSFSSRLWDIDGIRHIVVPHAEAAAFGQTEAGIDMRDAFNFGLSQRWQTHRGEGANSRQVDLLRWDVDTTFVSDNAEDDIGSPNTFGPSMFLFNDPSIPVFMRRNDRYFGMVRDSVNSSAEWKLSETTAILGDTNYDIRSGNVQQLDAGVSRYVHPDMSFYLGSRYLRPIIVDEPADGIYEQGSHSVVGAITYQLASRYWITYSQEYNFDFEKSVSSNMAMVRQYHRMFYSMSVSIDQSLDRQSFSLSMWPQGVNELSLGDRRYTGVVGMVREN